MHVLKKKLNDRSKSDMVNLIGQSFETNKEITIRLQQSGINYGSNEWNKLLELQNNIASNQNDNYINSSMSRDDSNFIQKNNSLQTKPSKLTTTILGIRHSPIKKVHKHNKLNKIYERFNELSYKAHELKEDILETEQEQTYYKEFFNDDDNEIYYSDTNDEIDSKISTIDIHVEKLNDFANKNLVDFIGDLTQEIKNIDFAISELESKTYSDLEKLEELKKDYNERWDLAVADYDQALEGKAIIAEDFKGKLVDRAE